MQTSWWGWFSFKYMCSSWYGWFASNTSWCGWFSFEHKCRSRDVGGFPSGIGADLLVWVVFLRGPFGVGGFPSSIIMCRPLGVGGFPSRIIMCRPLGVGGFPSSIIMCRPHGVGGFPSSIGAVFGVDSFPSSTCADLSVWVVFLRGPLSVGSFP